ncbi:MAG: sulfopyruvate decarboxylase subunit alpha [Nitrososphaerales archaeon]
MHMEQDANLFIYNGLKDAGIRFIVSVPDTLISPVLNAIDKDPNFIHIIATREEEGVGIAIGAYFGGYKVAILMQNTGLGNSLNAIASQGISYKIPLLMLMTLRGHLEEYNPADVAFGQATPQILSALRIPCYIPNTNEELYRTIIGAAKLAETSQEPVAILLQKHLFRKIER